MISWGCIAVPRSSPHFPLAQWPPHAWGWMVTKHSHSPFMSENPSSTGIQHKMVTCSPFCSQFINEGQITQFRVPLWSWHWLLITSLALLRAGHVQHKLDQSIYFLQDFGIVRDFAFNFRRKNDKPLRCLIVFKAP